VNVFFLALLLVMKVAVLHVHGTLVMIIIQDKKVTKSFTAMIMMCVLHLLAIKEPGYMHGDC